MHSEDHFSEEGLFRSRFSKSSVKFKGKWKERVPSHASVSKYYADKTYANLWFILLQVTKGFRFQKNKTVRFISVEGDRGAGARENRGREGYGRREKEGREEGSLRWREAGKKFKKAVKETNPTTFLHFHLTFSEA